MSTIEVRGGNPLQGEIKIQGSKNAILPMMAASILHKGTTVITNVPRIQDVFCMMGILESIGCSCELDQHTLTVDARVVTETNIPEDYVKGMRSSIMILGALLSRTGEAVTYFPGGCSIGKRPIDLHLHALRAMGVEVTEENEMIHATCGRLKGAEISFYYPSVGATENALLAAVLADGQTLIKGGAREPEIEELCNFLNHMGADITKVGTDGLLVRGVAHLHDCVFRVSGDRIVAGTYLAAVTAATGNLLLTGVNPEHIKTVIKEFQAIGTEIREVEQGVAISMRKRPYGSHLKTEPYPGFPTDLQSPMLSVFSIAGGSSSIEETVFEARYETAKELQKMGADITISGNCANIIGGQRLRGNWVEAPDLRGGAALVVAGLAAEGLTHITGCEHIMRGYEDICGDLSQVGATIHVYRKHHDMAYTASLGRV